MSIGSDIKISAVSKTHFTVVFTQFTSAFNNNNNNIYELQLGCHPVAVVILYVYKI